MKATLDRSVAKHVVPWKQTLASHAIRALAGESSSS